MEKFTEDDISKIEKSLNIKLTDSNKKILMDGGLSEMVDYNSHPSKLRLTRNHKDECVVLVNKKKEHLEIPDVLEGKKLSKGDKAKLAEGEMVSIGKNMFVQIDKELNSIIIRSSKELNIPNVIGNYKKYPGYTLTTEDKELLANGEPLAPKVLRGKEGYFLTTFSLTPDKKGIVFTDSVHLSDSEAQEYIKKYNSNDFSPKVGAPELEAKPIQEQTHDQEQDRMPAEIKEIEKEPIIGKIDYYGPDGSVEESITYTDLNSYLNAIKSEMNVNPDGFKYKTISANPEIMKAADDLVYEAHGAENPNSLDWYKEQNNKSEQKMEQNQQEQKVETGKAQEQELPQVDYKNLAEMTPEQEKAYIQEAARKIAPLSNSHEEYTENMAQQGISFRTRNEDGELKGFSYKLNTEGAKPIRACEISKEFDIEQFKIYDQVIKRNLDKEFMEALEKKDFEKLNKLSEEGSVPSQKALENADKMPNLTDAEKVALRTLFPNKDGEKELEVKEEKNTPKIKLAEKEEKKSPEIVQKVGHIINQGFRDM
jgi:hypothetical protein